MSLILQWCQLLKQVDPTQPSHPYIYATEKQCMLDTSEEYANLSKQNSYFNHIKKLSLEKIINISEHVIHEARYEEGVLYKLYLGTVFTTDYTPEHFIAELQQEAKDHPKKLQAPLHIFEVLQRMCERARAKRIEAKTNGIWNMIKFYIWSWFYDQSSRLKKPEVKKAQPFEIIYKNLLNSACSTVQSRILINIEAFEEELRVPEKERNLNNQASKEKFATPLDVGKKWVAQYSADKPRYRQISDTASDNRKRILVLKNLWEKLIEAKNILSSSESNSRVFNNDQTLLLPGSEIASQSCG